MTSMPTKSWRSPGIPRSANVGLSTHLIKILLAKASCRPVHGWDVEEHLASIVRIEFSLRVHGIRYDAPLIRRLIPAAGFTEPLIVLRRFSSWIAGASRLSSAAGAVDLCLHEGLPALLRDPLAARRPHGVEGLEHQRICKALHLYKIDNVLHVG